MARKNVRMELVGVVLCKSSCVGFVVVVVLMMSTQLQRASSPGITPVRPLEKCEVILKETCGVVIVGEVVKSPRMRTVR